MTSTGGRGCVLVNNLIQIVSKSVILALLRREGVKYEPNQYSIILNHPKAVHVTYETLNYITSCRKNIQAIGGAKFYTIIYRRLLRFRQLGGLVPVVRLGISLRYKASNLEYPLKIPPFYNKRSHNYSNFKQGENKYQNCFYFRREVCYIGHILMQKQWLSFDKRAKLYLRWTKCIAVPSC